MNNVLKTQRGVDALKAIDAQLAALNAQPLDPITEGPVLAAYAAAMKEVTARYPDDLDIQTMTSVPATIVAVNVASSHRPQACGS